MEEVADGIAEGVVQLQAGVVAEEVLQFLAEVGAEGVAEEMWERVLNNPNPHKTRKRIGQRGNLGDDSSNLLPWKPKVSSNCNFTKQR